MSNDAAPELPLGPESAPKVPRQLDRNARARQRQLSHPASAASDGLMGPIVRRRKITSLPLGSGNEFWGEETPPKTPPRSRQTSYDKRPESPRAGHLTGGFIHNPIEGILRRKQVSLDLLSAQEAEFFAPPPLPEYEEEEVIHEEEPETEELEEPSLEELEAERKQKKLFRPLRFSPAIAIKHRHAPHRASVAAETDEEILKALEAQANHAALLKDQVEELRGKLDLDDTDLVQKFQKTQEVLEYDTAFLKRKVGGNEMVKVGDGEDMPFDLQDKVDEDDGADIVRATKRDYLWAALLGVIMLAFTILLCTWHTHLDESALIRTPVGYACATPCDHRQFFEEGHSSFHSGQVIQLSMHLDPEHDSTVAFPVVEIIGVDSGEIKATLYFPPPDDKDRITTIKHTKVDFDDPGEDHTIHVYSSDDTTVLTFTLHTTTQSSLEEHSVLIAAILLVSVYVLILLEVIHRTLIAIYGSLAALFFLFLMNNGETESIASIMLLMEWSTLGLLFGMMLIVGELSHTGIFEWFAVRVLLSSKGSFRRLLILLCSLTALASAFLDNVTTMLLIAPVTIDMCKILEVDPRPYLISEVILSNIGGTATLIGDPPNIIIGTSIESIGFVDFIINIAPCVFFFLIPISLLLSLGVFNYYFTAFTMKELDSVELRKTYPIYDQPRLLIAGTVTFFVVLSFFLHPVHHKDTAWIALIGAFLTITFTNPHDVQDALRNHVEWDTLLFFAGLFVLVEVCAEMGLLDAIGDLLGDYIAAQPESSQLPIAVTLIMWVSAIASSLVDNVPWTTTMIPIIIALAEDIPTLSETTLAWALSFGACLGGNGTLLGASANIVTAGISTSKGYNISFLNFVYPGFLTMIATVAVSNIYMLIVFVWV